MTPLCVNLAVVGLALGLTACGISAAAPSLAPASSAALRGAASTSSAAPGSLAVPSGSSAASAGGQASAIAASSATSPAPGGITLTLTSASEVAIHATELLANRAAKSEAIEQGKGVSGALVLNGSGQPVDGSNLVLSVKSLSSDQRIRDGFIQRETLNSAKYPDVTFVPKHIDGLNGLPAGSGQLQFTMNGDATIKDVTKPLTWQVTAQLDQSGAKGQATTAFKFSDFGLTPPKAGPVIEVDQNLSVDITFQADRSAV